MKVWSGGEMFPGSVVLAIAGEPQTLLPRATQECTDHFVMLFTPHGRISDAGRRVAHEKQHDPELPNEPYRPVFPCSIRGGCGRRDTIRQ